MSNNPIPSSFDSDPYVLSLPTLAASVYSLYHADFIFLNSGFYEENRWQKFTRRLKEEPLIPIGCALTCYALFGATRSIRAGDHHTTNRMFRARIYAQGFTLAAMVAGSYYYQADRSKRKEFEGVLAEKKAREKNEAWIRELEARDQEDREWKAKRDKVRGIKAAKEAEEGGGGALNAVKEAVVGKEKAGSGSSVKEAVKDVLGKGR